MPQPSRRSHPTTAEPPPPAGRRPPVSPQVLNSMPAIHSDMGELATAQRACTSSARQRASAAVLRRQLDAGYLAACKCTNWRRQIQARAVAVRVAMTLVNSLHSSHDNRQFAAQQP